MPDYVLCDDPAAVAWRFGQQERARRHRSAVFPRVTPLTMAGVEALVGESCRLHNTDMRTAWTVAALLTLAACGGPLKYSVPSASNVPGAEAKVIADVRKDQAQTQVEIKAEHLPPPASVSSGATAYLVWTRKDAGTTWSRLGGLKYDEGDRKGTWTGSVPQTSFDLAITAETSAEVGSPSNSAVFTQRVN